MSFSFFNPFGIASFTSAPSSAENFYRNIRAAQGGESGAFRNNGFADTDAACTAIQLACVYEDSNRALEQGNPDTVTILLPNQEEQAGIAPNNSLSTAQRRAILKTRVMKPPRIHSSEMLTYFQRNVPVGSVVSVSFPKLTGYPTTPPTTSNFTISPNPTPSYIRLVDGVGIGTFTVLVELLVGEIPQKNFVYNFVDETGTTNESVTVTNVVAHTVAKQYYITGVFTKTHIATQCATTMSTPYWHTGNRRVRIAITQAASDNSLVMTMLRDMLERILPAATVYEFVRTPQDTTFTLDQDKLNLDRL